MTERVKTMMVTSYVELTVPAQERHLEVARALGIAIVGL